MVREFSAPDPKAKIKVATKCERVQPVVIGTDANGELIWEGREMPRWQMAMFRVAFNLMSEFSRHWVELTNHQEKGRDFEPYDKHEHYYPQRSKRQLDQMRDMYPRKK